MLSILLRLGCASIKLLPLQLPKFLSTIPEGTDGRISAPFGALIHHFNLETLLD